MLQIFGKKRTTNFRHKNPFKWLGKSIVQILGPKHSTNFWAKISASVGHFSNFSNEKKFGPEKFFSTQWILCTLKLCQSGKVDFGILCWENLVYSNKIFDRGLWHTRLGKLSLGQPIVFRGVQWIFFLSE